jgi:uncharacterized protein (TIGR02597 family)
MKTSILTLLTFLAITPGAFAQVYTPSVGFVSVQALGGSDTRFSAPLSRSPEFVGQVASLGANTVTVSGSPNWAASQWVYAAGVRSNTYFLEFCSGAKAGMFYTVTASSGDTVTLDLAGDTLSGAIVGDQVKIVPYWTLGTLFPGQQGVTTTTNITGAGSATKILVYAANAVGTNLSTSFTYYYYSGSASGGAGWRRVGGGIANKKDDDIIYSDSHIIVRQDGGAPTTTLTVAGNVATVGRTTVIGTLQNNTAQDNIIAVDIPVAITLAQSNLAQSGAFVAATTATGSGGDRLFVYDNAAAGINKSASATYYYYAGPASGGAGWRRIGGGISTIRDNEQVFIPGSGYVIRKAATTVASSTVWSIPLPY